jgi:3-deoxy-D-manno-octulosonic-acid transferase
VRAYALRQSGLRRLLTRCCVGAGMSATSAARWGSALAAPLARRLLSRMRVVCPMNATEAARLRALCPSARFGPLGDLKVAAGCACAARAGAPPAGAALTHAMDAARARGRFVWLAASTHAGEEEAAVAAHVALSVAPHRTLTLLAPRHPARAASVAAALAAAHPSLRVALHSSCGAASLPECDVFVVDALGLLPTLYAAARVALVGNSMLPGGRGHNLAEAAACRCALLCGPHLGPFAEMATQLGSLLTRVQDAAQLAHALAALRAAPHDTARRGEASAAAVARLAGDVVSTLARELRSALQLGGEEGGAALLLPAQAHTTE